jgi:hypothetical protein
MAVLVLLEQAYSAEEYAYCDENAPLRKRGMADVSSENDGSLKLEYDGGLGGLTRKERTHEAVEVLGGTNRLCPAPS